jgi:hypothetical protein
VTGDPSPTSDLMQLQRAVVGIAKGLRGLVGVLYSRMRPEFEVQEVIHPDGTEEPKEARPSLEEVPSESEPISDEDWEDDPDIPVVNGVRVQRLKQRGSTLLRGKVRERGIGVALLEVDGQLRLRSGEREEPWKDSARRTRTTCSGGRQAVAVTSGSIRQS